MKQNTFSGIKKMLIDLEIYSGQEDADAGTIMVIKDLLEYQFKKAANAEWGRLELTDFILTYNDVLEDIEDYAVCLNFINDVREIQRAIIDFFGEE